MIITGKDILNAKERRAEYLEKLSKDQITISLLLNIPGEIKDQPRYRLFSQLKFIELINTINNQRGEVTFQELLFLKTGPEGYVTVQNLSVEEVKEITLLLENQSPICRVLDLDVMFKEVKLERNRKRSCYLCNDLAINCAREKKHTLEELLEHIHLLIDDELKSTDLLLK